MVYPTTFLGRGGDPLMTLPLPLKQIFLGRGMPNLVVCFPSIAYVKIFLFFCSPSVSELLSWAVAMQYYFWTQR